MSMSKTEGNTSPDDSMLKLQSVKPDWAKKPDNSDNPHGQKDPQTMAKTTMQNPMLYLTFHKKSMGLD